MFQKGSISMGFPVAFEEEKKKSDFVSFSVICRRFPVSSTQVENVHMQTKN